MSAKKFLEVLERSGQLDRSTLNELRKQVGDGKQRVSAESIAKVLVEKGLLTKYQATKMVGEVAAMRDETTVPKPPPARHDDDDLGLAPIDGEVGPTPPPGRSSRSAAVDDILDDAGGLTPVEEAGTGLMPFGMAPPPPPLSLGPPPSDPFAIGDLSTFGSLPDLSIAESTVFVPRKKPQAWDSKLILGGITALLILLLTGVVLIWRMRIVPAQEMFELAERAYHEQAYSEAKQRFEEFAERYPRHASASKARVRIDLIRLRQDVNDPDRVLLVAQEVLPRIADEPDADVGREELPSLLPKIPQGFLQRARQATDAKVREELLARAKDGLALVNDPKYIPSSRRTPILPQIHRLEEDVKLLERMIMEDKELAKAIAEIGEAELGGNTSAAFERYHRLVREFPRVRDDESLKNAVTRIAARERLLVRVVKQDLRPLPTESRADEMRVVLSNRTGGGEPLPGMPVATFLASGSVFVLDAGSGRILWSRYVGDASPIRPVRVSTEVDADILVADTERHELIRARARSGEILWRVPIGEPFFEPIVSGPRLYVATATGRLLDIDATSGESHRQAVVPQRFSAPPASAPELPYVFQPGEHSNLYVLNAETLECEDVIYLGHRAGTIDVGPLLLSGHVFVAENFRVDSSRVHVLKIRGTGGGPRAFPTQLPVTANGRILVPLIAYGRRLMLLTDRGEIRVLDVDRNKNEDSVTDAGRHPSTHKEPLLGYPLADSTNLWVADNKFAKYSVQVTRKEVIRDATVTAAGDTFLASPQIFGNQIVHMRSIDGAAGVTVTSVDVDNPRRVIWQQQLGVPAAWVFANEAAGDVFAVTPAASLYQIDKQAFRRGYADTPTVSASGAATASFTTPIELSRKVTAFFNPTNNKQLLVHDPSAEASPLHIVTLPIDPAEVPCTPESFRGGLLTPTSSGIIRLLDLSGGKDPLLPFHPKLEPGRRTAWRRPVVIEPEDREFVIADDRRQIFRVGVREQPQPHLAELASTRLDFQLSDELAAAGDTVYGVVRTDATDVVVAISTSDLKVVKEWDLSGRRVTWGPRREGMSVFVVANERELFCFGPGRAERWGGKPVPILGQPADRPLVHGNDFLFASVRGFVWRMSGDSGEITAKTDVGEPLVHGPIAFGGRLVLCGRDGSLHVVAMPAAVANAGN